MVYINPQFMQRIFNLAKDKNKLTKYWESIVKHLKLILEENTVVAEVDNLIIVLHY